jgi:hypothetical protein
MCAHSSSGAEITEKIGEKLYPFIGTLIQEVLDYNSLKPLPDERSGIINRFYLLKSEFDSLSNYEIKLVFPSVLKVFNSKDNPEAKPSINIIELQSLTQKKEKIIAELVQQIEEEAVANSLEKSHPIYQLIFVFQTSFIQEKKQWNTMLNGWNLGCACFMAAQSSKEILHHH